jgi:hypothetical protein
MTGKEAKKSRINYGFTLSQIAKIFSYDCRQNIFRIEKMEQVAKTYEAKLNLLIAQEEQKKRYLKYYFKDTLQENFGLVHKRKRVVKVLVKSELQAQELSHLFSKSYTQSNTLNFYQIEL